MPLNTTDRNILRDLAKCVAEIGASPIQQERIRLWKRHNSLQSCRPMLLVFPEGSWRELLPESSLRCQEPLARNMEAQLRQVIYEHEHFVCDNVVVPIWWQAGKIIRETGWGLEPQRTAAPATHGAWHIDPVLHSAADLRKLRYPEVIYDERASQEAQAQAQELFGDILDVQFKGRTHISFHLMQQYSFLRGLTETMLDMYENPGLIHEFMTFATEGHQRLMRQYVELGLFDLNNNGSYHNSGGNGWTDELPGKSFDGVHVELRHLWGSAEAQEMAQVGPEQHAEFALAYEKKLLEPFALSGYGCCEDLTRKLDLIFEHLPNIRRISISPWADVDACAAKLAGRRAIFSWKPNPAHLVGTFNETAVRAYIRHTIDICRQHNCALEIILKDTHTCENHPERFGRWTRIAREEILASSNEYKRSKKGDIAVGVSTKHTFSHIR